MPSTQWVNYQWALLCESVPRCEFIRPSGRRCHVRSQLEWSHREPTALNGRGRGKLRRLLDIRKHRGSYWRLCRRCHREYDRRFIH